MTVTPQTLTSISGNSNWYPQLEYRWRSTQGDYEIYGLYHTSNNNYFSNQDIKVNTSTNTWEDSGNHHPTNVTENADGTITLDDGTSTLLLLQKPTASTASWLSSGGGGGTSTEDVSVPQLSLTETQLIGSGIPSGTFTFRGPVGVLNETLQPGWQDKTITVGSNGLILENDIFVSGDYELQSVGNANTFIELRLRVEKKVFCNFW